MNVLDSVTLLSLAQTENIFASDFDLWNKAIMSLQQKLAKQAQKARKSQRADANKGMMCGDSHTTNKQQANKG